jgi:hypothetical protein
VSVNVSNLNAGTYYFRVKHDNVTSTSWRTPYRFTISANAGARTAETIEEASLLTFSSYPNPTNAHAVVDIQLANASFLRMELFNSIGENIQTLYEGDMEGGVIHSLPYKMENLPAGIYFLQAQGMDFTKTLRIIKQ